jgi:hypothetical protein
MATRLKPEERIPSTGEQTFITYWNMFGDGRLVYTTEYKFHPTRKWKFDFAWQVVGGSVFLPLVKVAVEIEGAVWAGGRHTRGTGYTADLEKYNSAVSLGWKVLRYSPQMLEADPQGCIEQVLTLLRGNQL